MGLEPKLDLSSEHATYESVAVHIKLICDEILAGSWTEEGVKAWWTRPNPNLQNRTPEICLQLGLFGEVLQLALSGMSQYAT